MGVLRRTWDALVARPAGASAPPTRINLPRLTDYSWYLGPVSLTIDPTMTQQRSKANLGFRTNYGLLREIPYKDGFINGLIQQRQSAVLERLMYLRNADTSTEALESAAFMASSIRVLNRETAGRGGWTARLRELLDAVPYGITVMRLEWDFRAFAPKVKGGDTRGYSRPWFVPVDMIQEDLDRVGFDIVGNLAIYAPRLSEAQAAANGFTPVDGATDWYYPHPLSYFVFNPYAHANCFHGSPLLATVFYAAWFLRVTRTWHGQFIERNQQPVATIEQDTQKGSPSDEDREKANAVLNTIQRETGILMPPGMSFRWHELMSNASTQAITDFETFLRKEASSALIGQTSTAITERSGSQSSAEVQERVAQGIISMDALMLQGAVNQFINMVCGVNKSLVSYDLWPEWIVQVASAQDLAKRLEQFKGLTELGAKIAVDQVNREFAIDEPIPGQDVLAIQPAAYAGANGQPSQQTAAKTKATATQRATKKPSATQAQPRGG